MNFKKNYYLTLLLACFCFITKAENQELHSSKLNTLMVENNSSANADLTFENCSSVTIKNKIISVGPIRLDNIGDAIADSSVMGYYLSSDMIIDDKDYLFDQFTFKKIKPDGYRYLTRSVNISDINPPIPAGDYYIVILADKYNTVDELDESNNACINDDSKFTVTYGCNDRNASNYNPEATYFDDSLCVSCTDGIKNGTESGIDCGGNCPTKCIADSTNCEQRDREILKIIYNSIDIEKSEKYLRKDFAWNLDEPFENWEGVVFNESGCLVELDLSYYLKGSTPIEIGELSELKKLSLDNRHSGALPASIGSLSKLDSLTLGRDFTSIPTTFNNLTNLKYLQIRHFSLQSRLGGIPSFISSLSNLEHLNLSGNSIKSIPDWLSNLANLEILVLSGNELTGDIPVSLGNLTKLKLLWLQNNKLTGNIPSSLGNLSALSNLDLNSNKLTGSIPTSLGNLTNLTKLNLYGNKLSGSIPATLGNLTNLRGLDLFGNDLSGEIPNSIGNLANLETLYLSQNNLSGIIPASLGKLANLEILSIMFNNLSGSIPTSLGNLSNLQRLRLKSNQLSGNIPASLGSLSKLQALWLYDNQLSGNIPESLGYLSNLEELQLQENQLSGNIPSTLGDLPSLNDLRLQENQLSGCIPSSFYSFCNRKKILLDSNFNWDAFCRTGFNRCPTCSDGLKNGDEAYIDCGGSCPDECTIEPDHCKRRDLDALIAFSNSLNGVSFSSNIPSWFREPIENWQGITYNEAGCVEELYFNFLRIKDLPTEFGELKDLKKLVLDRVDIEGSMPSSLGNLKNLDTLDMTFFYTGFADTIPTTIGNLVNLKYLRMTGVGPIPEELGNLTNLEYLNLSGITSGKLTGNIPASFTSLSNLKLLDLTHNKLSGCFTEELYNLCDQDIEVNVNSGNSFDIEWNSFCNNEPQSCANNTDKLNTNQTSKISNYPNPFKTNTTIDFELPTESKTSIKVYNTLGEQIAVLIDEITLPKGKNTIGFNGSKYPAGIYYYSIEYNDQTNLQKMTLMK